MTGYMPVAKSHDWETPQWFFDKLDREFGFDLDPASSHQNAKCDLHYTIEEDGLIQPWTGHTVWLNPPYGREINDWLGKAFNESTKNGATVVALIPTRSDTEWWHRYVMQAHEIRFVKKRLHFVHEGGKTDSAPFPSVLVVLRAGVPDGPPAVGWEMGGKQAAEHP